MRCQFAKHARCVHLLTFCSLAVGSLAAGQGITFDDVSAARGIGSYMPPVGLTSGLAAADYDDDGDIDFFVPTQCGLPNQLYQNDGAGNYTNVAGDVGLASNTPSRGGLFFDYDGDGDLDLIVQHDRFANNVCNTRPFTLYQQQADGTFTDVTVAAGLALANIDSASVHAGGMCAGDINNDGYLDLCAVQWFGETYLFLNNGDGTFTDISASSSLASGGESPWQPVMFDFNDDGLLDIFIAVDFLANHLWINQGDNTFVDEAQAAGCGSAWNEMGVTLGDYDNDGLIDMYVTNIDRDLRHNALFRNVSTGGQVLFDEVALDMGCAHGWWGWGCTFFDADRDGRVDIASTNGFNDPVTAFPFDPSKFFWNQSTTFVDASNTVGFNDTYISGALMAFDFDRDGDLDLLQSCNPGPIRLMANMPAAARGGAPNNYLVIQPRQPGPNRFAIGAIVRATIGGTTQSRVLTAGISHNSQEPTEAFFGLGEAALVDTITIEWPDGEQTVVSSVAGNQVLTIMRPADTLCPGDANDDGAVNLADLLLVIANWGGSGPAGDVNGDDAVNLADLLAVIANWASDCE